MNFQVAEFVKSAPNLELCPPPGLPEVCMAGRSNVGKSSLINKLVNQHKLARTSNRPGKTQLINYYNIDDTIYLVDLPGFGYAKVPDKERQRWGRDIREYLQKRDTLHLVIHLVDARHKPTKLDQDFFYWLAVRQLPFAVILSKADKLSNNKQKQSESRVRKLLSNMNIEVPIILTSTEDKTGIHEVQKLIKEFTL